MKIRWNVILVSVVGAYVLALSCGWFTNTDFFFNWGSSWAHDRPYWLMCAYIVGWGAGYGKASNG